ncbi:hypothetical protein [Kitasatospora sp. NPDC001175]
MTNTVDKSLPIEAFLLSSVQSRQLEIARNLLIKQCMKRSGYDYTPPLPPQSAVRGQATHRYDVADAANGYHPAGPSSNEKMTSEPALSSDEQKALGIDPSSNEGPASTASGPPVRAGGCMREAYKKLAAEGGIIQDSELAVNINFDSYKASMADARLKEVFQKWSGCMKGKGFSYATPGDAVRDKRWLAPKASSEEISTATADSACRQQVNVIGTWFAVESAYESQAIQANLQRLIKVKQGIEIASRNASAIISASGSPES